MRSGQQKQRSRGRSNNGGNGGNNPNNNNNNNNRKGQNPLTRTYDSSGPDVKIRGTAQNIAEKYMTLARDASSAGDRVMAENYLQHAEHYNRIIAAAQAMFQERFQRDDRQDFNDRDDDEADGNTQEPLAAEAVHEQPQQQFQPRERDREQPRQQHDRQQHSDRPHREPRPPRDGQPREQREIQARDVPQPVPVEQPRVVIDESTPQPVIEGTPAEVQIEAEVSSQENAAATPARRRSAGRPRRTPRKAAAENGDESAQAEDASAPVEVPAE